MLASVADEPGDIREALLAALQEAPDLVLLLSGSSAGSRDYSAAVLRAEGQLLVHGVAVRPGHPVILGMVRDVPVIGVPGYPVSAALTGELFVLPLLRQWLGLAETPREQVRAIMTRKLVSPTGDDDYVRVTLAQVGERLLAAPLGQGAGVITSLVRADGLALVPRFSEGLNKGAETLGAALAAAGGSARQPVGAGQPRPAAGLAGAVAGGARSASGLGPTWARWAAWWPCGAAKRTWRARIYWMKTAATTTLRRCGSGCRRSHCAW